MGEWYQKEADLNRQLVVSFFPSDNSVELVDLKTRKTFLRRTKIEELNENDFFIGAKLLIFGKQINILDYGELRSVTYFGYRWQQNGPRKRSKQTNRNGCNRKRKNGSLLPESLVIYT